MGCASSSSQMDNVVPPSAYSIQPEPLRSSLNDLPEAKSSPHIIEDTHFPEAEIKK